MSGWWLFSYLMLWALMLLLAWLGMAILRQLGLIYIRLGGAVGARQSPDGPPLAEVVDLPDRYRAPVLEEYRLLPTNGRVGLLLFISPTCQVCDEIIPHLPAYSRSIRSTAELVVVLSDEDTNGKFGGWRAGRPRVLVDAELSSAFSIPAYPYGVAVDEGAVVRSKGTVNTVPHLESLLEQALVGDEPPTFQPATSEGAGSGAKGLDGRRSS